MSVNVLYTTHAIATGGPNGHPRAAGGLGDVGLAIPKAQGRPGRGGRTTPRGLVPPGAAFAGPSNLNSADAATLAR